MMAKKKQSTPAQPAVPYENVSVWVGNTCLINHLPLQYLFSAAPVECTLLSAWTKRHVHLFGARAAASNLSPAAFALR